jgi:hypothetical protein
MKKPSERTRETAEALAIQALTFLAQEPESLGRFLAMTGIEPAQIRAAAREPGFLTGVLEHMLADESLLIAFAASAGIDPAQVARARAAMGRRWERDVP